MTIESPDADILSVHTYWDSDEEMQCPLCNKKIYYAFNDGGRDCVTLKGTVHVITNYYRCKNPNCDLHKSFPIVHPNVIANKKFGKDVWERVIRYHFKTHLDYAQIAEILWDDLSISISKGTIQEICNTFKKQGVAFHEQKTLEAIKANGKIVLTLDGAQPKKGRPALWIFTDHLTKRTLTAQLLETASAPVLCKIMKKIEEVFEVPITAVISDKQKNIINAVQLLNPDIPHVYCQYHFLNHIMEPIQAKDSHLATQLKKSVRKFSIIVNQVKGYLNHSDPEFNPLYLDLSPLSEELKNAISVSGRKWEIMAGIEIYENLRFISNELKVIIKEAGVIKYFHSIKTIYDNICNLITKYNDIYEEIQELLSDSKDLRKSLAKTYLKGKTIQKITRTWVYRLQSRLKRKNLEYIAEKLKYQRLTHQATRIEIWQQWIRLEQSYHKGLYHHYDDSELSNTNNDLEQKINQTKRHFRKWLGQQDYQAAFERHGEDYTRLMELDYSPDQINEILWEQSVAYVPNKFSCFEAFQPIIKRNWRIRELNSGNISKLKENLQVV